MWSRLETYRQFATVTLDDEQIDELRSLGSVTSTRSGDVLYEAGDAEYCLVVVLSGRTETVDRSDGEDAIVNTSGPGEFEGELGLLTGQTALAACVVREGGEVIMIPMTGVQRVVATNPELGDILVAAFTARRQLMMLKAASTLTLIGRETSPRIERLQEFTALNRIPCRWLDPADADAIALLGRLGADGSADVWAVVRGTKILKEPGTLEIARAVGLDLPVCGTGFADLIVIGAGPAGLSAAVYGASEGLTTVVVDKNGIGGQAGTSSRIENYLGFPTGISGGDLAFKAEVQAVKFGARVSMPRQATSLHCDNGLITVQLNDETELRGRAVILATGARYRDLGLPDQDSFQGVGIYYAATELEARRCRDGDVVVVGGGNSAGQAAMFLSRACGTVHLVYRGPDLHRSMSQYLVSRLEYTPNIRIHTECTISEIRGGERLEAATILHSLGDRTQVPACGLFAMIGADPGTHWLRGTVDLDDKGFILTGADVAVPGEPVPTPFQTSRPGVFAIGDVRSGSVKRVASAVGEGSVVMQAIHRYLSERHVADRVVTPA